jgi:hypothetical protein
VSSLVSCRAKQRWWNLHVEADDTQTPRPTSFTGDVLLGLGQGSYFSSSFIRQYNSWAVSERTVRREKLFKVLGDEKRKAVRE